jgi:hypothetical protein
LIEKKNIPTYDRFALEGKLCLYFEPPGFDPSAWTNSPDTKLAEEVTALTKATGTFLQTPTA